jgi:hypothetical protein
MSEWRMIAGTSGNWIDTEGNVLCVNLKPKKSRILWSGYLWVSLTIHGVPTSRSVHRVVLETFAGPPPSSRHQAAHNDGSRTNNSLSNLRWALPSENLADRWDHGTMTIGTENGRAVLDEAGARRIRALRQKRLSFADIASAVGVSKRQVMRVASGEHWGWLT